mgnify:CR=1 FL=1
MPRDSAGNYALPAGNPVVSGTVIDTTWANPTMTDIATAIQDSLSRSGEGGMLVAFRNVDGTEAAPGITFSNELGTGMYRAATGDMRAAVQGVGVVRFRDDSGAAAGEQNPLQVWDGSTFANVLTVTYTGQLALADGTAGAPTYSFSVSPATGMWSSGLNKLDWSLAGLTKLQLDSAALSTEVPLELSTGTLPAAATVRDGAIAYNGVGGISIKVGTAWATIPSNNPTTGNLTLQPTPLTTDGSVIEGVFNLIDTTLATVSLSLPAGAEGLRWGYVDMYRQFQTNNCILIPNGTDKIENVAANYNMNMQGSSGVMRYTVERGWLDTGGMS